MSDSPLVYRRVRAEFALQRADIDRYGFANWLGMKSRRVRTWVSGRECLGRLASRWARYPLLFRPASSDLHVFRQIFIEREYSCFDDMTDAGLVIDCGANVGYSAAYFLSRFPNCSVIAIEPDQSNFALLERNLAPYGSQARLIRGGVWSHATTLKVSTEQYRDGLDWSRQVAECDPTDESAIRAVDIASLLRTSSFERISLLKVDIEGAEAVMFGSNYEPWLPRTDNIAIELHADSIFGDAPTIFDNAISGMGFTVTHSGELTVCRRPATPDA